MKKKDVAMMLVCGLGRLVDGAIDVSGHDDCCRDAVAGEDVLTLLPDASSLGRIVPSRCDDDVLCCSCPRCPSKGCLP